ncbi:uncharacterized protein LOC131657154 [Vicia villosa]|uniref:uncharacterized protein LOC131657154 n=1 Tax=Vicia villosa TaxID=3911 RepID=UPI00273B5D80|nr:uncharacterized protein LOC131657154 [Vicia villosa]
MANQVKACGETIIEQYMVGKILKSLISRFDNIMVAIEESKDPSTISKEKIQSSLEAHEQIMEERNVDKAKDEIALYARFVGRDNKVKGKWSMNRGRGNYQNNGGKDSQISNKFNIPKCNANKKDSQEAEVKFAGQEDDDKSMPLMVITEAEDKTEWSDHDCQTR